MAKPKSAKLKAILTKPPADSGWHYIPVPATIGEKFEKKDGSRRIVCAINGSEAFQCALIPWQDIFTIIVNKSKRDKLKIAAGDEISVEIEQDESKYGLPMPEEFQEVLNQDPEGNNLFHSLTAGKQRSILYFVGKVKDIDKRIHTALIFVEHLKRNDGKIDHARLQSELKRPMI
ncbi:hypothetical protein BH20ACI2_BH20ACI2_08170 [soil metagenome]